MSTFQPAPIDIPDVEIPKSGPLKLSIFVTVLSLILEIAAPGVIAVNIFGYILTPFVVVACLVRARANDLKASPNPYFDRTAGGFRFLGKTFIKRMQVVTFLAFLVGIVVIWRIASEVASR